MASIRNANRRLSDMEDETRRFSNSVFVMPQHNFTVSERELDYRLMKELWCFTKNRISVRFEYEYRDALNGVQWMRAHGNEHWEFDESGLMQRRDMSANDYPIQESERRYRN